MSSSRKNYNTFSPCQGTPKPKQQSNGSPEMASKDPSQLEPSKAALQRRKSRANSIENDVQRLAEMGYTQELSRGFSVLSILGTAFSLTNSWFGLSAAMATGINSGGPVLLVYGVIIVAIASVAVGISLSELASAIPNAGGQYFWASVLAPPKYARISSYLTGWFAYAGAVFTSASVSLSMASAIVGMYQLSHPDFVIEAWHVVVTYEIFNVVAFLFNVYGKILPKITTSTLYISIASFTTIIIAVPTAAPTRNTAKYVFTTFINNTGWKENGMAFILGLINTNWPFSCLDCATHLAEEVGSPERAIPIAIMGTIAMGFCTAWPFAIVMMLSIQDTTAVTTTPTGVPILEIFYQALDKAGALGLESLIVLTGTGCQIACHTWQARLCWSFARDSGLPGSSVLSKVNYKLDTPLAAHTVSCIIDGLVGLLYLGSSAAFNSMVTATITLLYLSYSVPVVCLLIKGRNNIVHGPFWLGKFGLAANVVLLGWTLFTFVMYSFPTTRPVNAGNMNYISAVYGVLGIIIATDWFARGRKQYRIQSVERRSSITGADRAIVTGAGVHDKSPYVA